MSDISNVCLTVCLDTTIIFCNCDNDRLNRFVDYTVADV